MSRHPSPASSQAQPISNPPAQLSKSKSKQSHPMGITAGAEDVKYQAKYRELKRKVKEIEAENDKLHFKVLTAKRNIQRMKLERAILYERLASIPPSPEFNDRPLPSTQHGPHAGEPSPMDADPNYVEYLRTHPNATGPPPPGVHDQGVPQPPMHMNRRSSAGEPRQLPPLPPLPSMLDPPRSPRSSRSHHDGPPAHHERTRSQSSSHSRTQQQPPPPPPPSYHMGTMQYQENLPPMQHVLHSPPSTERERESRPRRHDLHELAGAAQQQETHGRVVDHAMAPISPRTHSFDTRSTTRIHNHQRMGPGTYINRDNRERDRDRDLEWEHERERELNYSNSRQRERESTAGTAPVLSPPIVHRSRGQPPLDYPEHHLPSSRVREEPGYYHDAPPPGQSGGGNGSGGSYARVSRSGTPGSASGSGANDGPSRPDSRSPYYDLDRSRSYRLRPVNPGPAPAGGEDLDFVHEDGRSHSRDRNSTSGGGSGSGSGGFPPPPPHRETDPGGRLDSRREVESRKRNRNDMDVDAEIDEPPAGTGSHHMSSSSYSGGHLSEERDRGMKRYHRGGDNIEDVRMGP